MAGSVLIISSFPQLNPAPLAPAAARLLPGRGAAVRRQATLSALHGNARGAPGQELGQALARAPSASTTTSALCVRLHRDDDATAFPGFAN
ncbi:MAG: hypothetical protein IPN02_18835 [Candidatus Microthrix sp.]|uniref:Uncharacterized protein n=1 Tax=Candidatus Neomicrothrix subdominans TaxID=2954438 RepID=A0A936TG82_9ACTN|nr:hypothetical protein [Candidatus Microthrix subdominans]